MMKIFNMKKLEPKKLLLSKNSTQLYVEYFQSI